MGLSQSTATGLVVLSLTMLLAGRVHAHGGRLRLPTAPAGPYIVSVWTRPTPPSVGRVDVSVAVMRPGTHEAVLDADARVSGQHLGSTVTTSARAVLDPGWFSSWYHADLEIPVEGRWRITVSVAGPEGSGSAGFEMDVRPPSPVSWPLVGAAAVVLLLMVLAWRRFRPAHRRLDLFPVLAALIPAAAGPAFAATLYVTNTKSDSVSVIDTTTLEVTHTIPLGKGKPNRIAFHPDGKTAWVIYDKSHDIGIIDADTGHLVKRVKIGGNPYNLTFTPDGRHLYVLDWGSETSNDEVIIYDLTTGQVNGRIEVSTWPAYGVFTLNGKAFYVSSETAGNVAAIDTVSRVITHTVWTGGDAMGLALTADQRWLYAAAGEERKVVKVETATNAAVGTIPLPGIVHDVVLTPDGEFLYATLRRANQIAVVRTADARVVATIPQPGYPDLITMEPTGRYAFVTNRHANLVTVIVLRTHTQVKAIPVGKAPHGMALRPEPVGHENRR